MSPTHASPPAADAVRAMSIEDLSRLKQEFEAKASALGALIVAKLANDPWVALAKGEGPEPDRAVGIDEAAEMLAMAKDYLYRHKATFGGYTDDDRKVKFPMRALKRHVQGRKRST